MGTIEFRLGRGGTGATAGGRRRLWHPRQVTRSSITASPTTDIVNVCHESPRQIHLWCLRRDVSTDDDSWVCMQLGRCVRPIVPSIVSFRLILKLVSLASVYVCNQSVVRHITCREPESERRERYREYFFGYIAKYTDLEDRQISTQSHPFVLHPQPHRVDNFRVPHPRDCPAGSYDVQDYDCLALTRAAFALTTSTDPVSSSSCIACRAFESASSSAIAESTQIREERES